MAPETRDFGETTGVRSQCFCGDQAGMVHQTIAVLVREVQTRFQGGACLASPGVSLFCSAEAGHAARL